MKARSRWLLLLLALHCPFILADKALDELISKAKSGDAAAQFDLAGHYAHGEGVKQDEKQAAKWYNGAAEKGDPYAQRNLALMYQEGRGIKQDETKAANWYSKSASGFTSLAKQGDADAQMHLAQLYEGGHGVQQNATEAANWYTQSAKQGHPEAQANLARLYYQGQGVEQDYKQAYFWIFIASKASDATSDAAQNRDMVGAQLSPEELKAVEQQALALLNTPPPATATAASTKTALPNVTATKNTVLATPPIDSKAISEKAVPEKAVPEKAIVNNELPAKSQLQISAAQAVNPEPVITTNASEKPETIDTNTQSKKSGKGWIVQVASLSNQANANKMIKQLKAKGFTAFSVLRESSKGSSVIVMVGPKPTKDAANQVKQSVDKAMGLKTLVIAYPAH